MKESEDKIITEIEARLKSSLGSTAPAYSEEDWAEMELLLDKELPKKSKKLFWFFLLFIMFLVTASLPIHRSLISKTSQPAQPTNSRNINSIKVLNEVMPNQLAHETRYEQPMDIQTQTETKNTYTKPNSWVNASPIAFSENPETAPRNVSDKHTLKSLKSSSIPYSIINNNLSCTPLTKEIRSQYKKSPFTNIYKWSVGIVSNVNHFNEVRNEKDANSPIKRLPNISVGIGTRLAKNNWFVESGISYGKLRLNTNYLTPSYDAIYDTTYVNTNLFKNLYGKRMFIYNQEIDTSYKQASQYIACTDCRTDITYLRLPLSVGYSIQRQKLRPAVSIGLNMLIPIGTSGKIQNIEQEISDLQVSDLYKINIGASAKLGASYSISKSIDFLCDITYTQRTLREFDRNDIFKNAIGIRTGLLYRLGTKRKPIIVKN